MSANDPKRTFGLDGALRSRGASWGDFPLRAHVRARHIQQLGAARLQRTVIASWDYLHSRDPRMEANGAPIQLRRVFELGEHSIRLVARAAKLAQDRMRRGVSPRQA
jgi:hypothetical protein